MSMMQRQLTAGLRVSCCAPLIPILLSCAAELPQDGDSDSVESSSARLSGPQRGCGARFVAPLGNDRSATQDSNCLSYRQPCRTISHAVAVACKHDELFLASGDYQENVVIDKSVTLHGAGRGTVLYPELSSPNPCDDASLCDGAASNVILVRANDVRIESLVIDGDNPELTSGIIRGGADIDARNGIVADYVAGRFDGLIVENVVVRNVYFRGIYAASGGSFTFRGNHLSNIAGDVGSIAILNFGGAGTITGNEVDSSTDAIASNHSGGVLINHNSVQNSSSGIHTDNAGDTAGAVADRIVSNRVSSCAPNGYGIFTFIPYVAPLVRDNTILGCTVGLAAFGEGGSVTPKFVGNLVDARGAVGSVGALVTTSKVGFGSSDIAVELVGNTLRNAEVGIYLQQEPESVNASRVTCNRIERNGSGIVSEAMPSNAHQNAIVGNGVGVDESSTSTGVFDARDNWWGCAAGPSASGCDNVIGTVDASSPLAESPSLHRCVWPRCGGGN